jgi:hypothetical protein
MRRSRWGRQFSDVELLLHEHSPSPRPEFIDAVAVSLRRRDTRRRVPSRIAFASALTTVMLGTFAAFGGLSYAATSADRGTAALKQAAAMGENAPRVSERSPAADQYTSPPPPPPGGAGVLGGGQGAGQVSAAGELPFTGFPLLTAVAVGLGFLLLGVILRRRELRR